MKKFTKLLGVVLIMALVMSMGISAFADSKITINRDSSWTKTEDLEEGESNKATYTYYKIFDAEITTAGAVDPATGELTEQGAKDGVVVYTISGTDAAAKVAVLPSIFTAKLAADGKYYITLADSSTGAADIVTALKTMVAANTTLFPGTATTSDANPVVITVPSDGYYLIEASNGKDLAVQTIGDVTINEKNDYPTIDKKQRKGTNDYADTKLSVEVGSYIDYQVTVHIPADANKAVAVIDKMSSGLEYDATTGLTLDPNIAYTALASTDAGYDSTITDTAKNGWQIKFADTVVEANRGKDIVITFRAKVTSAALTDTGRENEVTLNYDNNNYILKDKVEYTTYFAGIYKVDPKDASADMSGVKFKLTLNDAVAASEGVAAKDATEVKVSYDATAGCYVVDPNGSSEVETRKDGDYYTIKIRGLDNDKTYILTETEAATGYNLLETPVTLTKTEDTGTAFADKLANTFDKVENNKGTVLPSTGGIGTTIFYVVGSIMVVAAGVLLITKKRMGRE